MIVLVAVLLAAEVAGSSEQMDRAETKTAVAVAMAEGAERGLAQIDDLAASGVLRGYHLLPASRADLLRRLGRFEEAATAYGEALSLTRNEAERRFLEARLLEVSSGR